MEISVVLSTELKDEDWAQITKGFNQSFDLEKQLTDLVKYYTGNTFGYCFHAICRNEIGEIVAHSSIFPYEYLVNGKPLLFGLSGGSYVLKDYRKEAFLYVDLIEELKNRCSREGVTLTYGVPNKNSFQLTVSLLGSTFLKDLRYFVFPISVSMLLFKKRLIFVDRIFKYLIKGWIIGNKFLASIFVPKYKENGIEIRLSAEMKSFRFGDNYHKISFGEIEGVFRIVQEAGINTAYIMDYRQKGKRTYQAMVFLVAEIEQKEEVDVILFVGDIRFTQGLMLKVPKRYEPQRLPITYDLLDSNNEELRKILTTPEKWEFGLLNFDAR